MPNAISAPHKAHIPLPTQQAHIKGQPEVVVLAMDPSMINALADGVANKMTTQELTGKTGTEVPVELRAPTMTVGEAAQTIGNVMAKLPVLLAGLAAAVDPVLTEPGTEVRVTEGAVSSVQSQGADIARGDITGAQEANGADVDIADRSSNVGAWIKSNPFANLLSLLRQLLLKFEAMDRENGSKMVILQREMTIQAGDKGVEKAREGLIGAIGSTVVMTGIGAAGVKQSLNSSKMRTDSNIGNLNKANTSAVSAASNKHDLKANALPSAELRPARNVDGSQVAKSTGQAQDSADLQSDLAARSKAQITNRNEVTTQPEATALNSTHSERMAMAEIPAARAAFLAMMSPSLGATITAGVNIEAEMTAAEVLLLQNVAETFKRVADSHQDQQMKNRDAREATGQMLEALLNLAASTSSHIIQKS